VKAAEFDYVRVRSVREACERLGAAVGEAKIIAGGQTLVPLMAVRLARPALLVDINDVAELQGIAVEGGSLALRAGTRQRAAELAPEVRERLPLLAKALRFVGHIQTRNRGTVGGSLVHGDPSAEVPLVAVALDAILIAESARGRAEFSAVDFFRSAMVTALAPDQCLIEARFPLWPEPRVGTGFHEVASREGDFAIVAAAAQVALAPDGTCARIAAAVGGAAPTPVRLGPVETALRGGRLADAEVRAATEGIDAMLEPTSDVHATADYRRRAARALVERAILDARDAAAKS
jgi:CO/xanthine dehydrogenase FAD-binding subunit